MPGQAYALLQAMLQAMTCGPNSMRRQYGQVLSFSTAPVAGVQHLGMPTTGTQPVLTVNQPTPNAVVGLQPFHIAGQVTDRGGSEPITIDSVTVQIDGGPLIPATLKTIHNKTLTQVSFDTSAQISGGNDPHTVTVVATNDQGQRTTKTVTVYTGALVQVDAPAVLLDFVTRASFKADDPEVLALIGGIQRQLGSLSDTLASAGKVLIGPNLIVQALTAYESLVRVGFWIENPDFPVVAPSAAFPLPRLSDAAAAAAFAATTVLTTPALGTLASFALSIPVTTLQHLVDATKPALKTQAALQGFALDTVTVQTSGPATVNTNVTGHVLEGILPASFTISETVGTQAVPGVLHGCGAGAGHRDTDCSERIPRRGFRDHGLPVGRDSATGPHDRTRGTGQQQCPASFSQAARGPVGRAVSLGVCANQLRASTASVGNSRTARGLTSRPGD